MKVNCERCVALWREYGEATRVHVELIKAQESAAGRDVDRFRELEAQVEFAGERRESARAAIKAHLAHFHGQSRTLTA